MELWRPAASRGTVLRIMRWQNSSSSRRGGRSGIIGNGEDGGEAVVEGGLVGSKGSDDLVGGGDDLVVAVDRGIMVVDFGDYTFIVPGLLLHTHLLDVQPSTSISETPPSPPPPPPPPSSMPRPPPPNLVTPQ